MDTRYIDMNENELSADTVWSELSTGQPIMLEGIASEDGLSVIVETLIYPGN